MRKTVLRMFFIVKSISFLWQTNFITIMKNFLPLLLFAAVIPFYSSAQCTLENSTDCECLNSNETDCDLLPDITVSWETGYYGHTEYAPGEGLQSGELNYTDNWFEITPEIQAMGRIRVSGKTPNIGVGPLNIRGADQDGYRWMICYDSGVADTFQVYDPNWNESTYCPDGSNPKHISWQRIYHKNSDGTMSFWEKMIGTMEYHPTHGHMHFDEWVEMTLRVPDENNMDNPLEWPIIGEGAKIGFCVMDLGNCSGGGCMDDETVFNEGTTLYQSDFPNYGLGGGSYGCSPVSQGISSGYTDTYGQYLDGMFINIPLGTCNGDYAVVLVAENELLVESDPNNNHAWFPITLTEQTDVVNWEANITSNQNPNGICGGSVVELSANHGTDYLWSTGETTQSIEVSSSGSYSVTVSDNNCGVSGTSEAFEVSFVDIDAPTVVGPTEVTFDQTATLTASGNGVLSWYDQEEGGNLLSDNAEFVTPNITGNVTFYASNKIEGETNNYQVGPLQHEGQNEYSNGETNGYIEFDAFDDFTLNSVDVFTNEPGERIIQLLNSNGDIVEDLSVNVPMSDDNAYTINLNFYVPMGSNYRLTTNGDLNIQNFGNPNPQFKRTDGDDAPLYYPYVIDDVVSLDDSPYGTDWYYYFYDWSITTSSSCEIRTPHSISVNTVDVEENYFNELTVAPNPTSRFFNVELTLETVNNIHVQVLNLLGEVVYEAKETTNSFSKNIDLESLSKGVYTLNLNVNNKQYVEKIILQ